jgi:hypothetical protein
VTQRAAKPSLKRTVKRLLLRCNGSFHSPERRKNGPLSHRPPYITAGTDTTKWM